MMHLRTRRPYSPIPSNWSRMGGERWQFQVNATTDRDVLARRPRRLNPCRPGRPSRLRETDCRLGGATLVDRLGPGFRRSNLVRMVSFAHTYPNYDETLALAHRLTAKYWTTLPPKAELEAKPADRPRRAGAPRAPGPVRVARTLRRRLITARPATTMLRGQILNACTRVLRHTASPALSRPRS